MDDNPFPDFKLSAETSASILECAKRRNDPTLFEQYGEILYYIGITFVPKVRSGPLLKAMGQISCCDMEYWDFRAYENKDTHKVFTTLLMPADRLSIEEMVEWEMKYPKFEIYSLRVAFICQKL